VVMQMTFNPSNIGSNPIGLIFIYSVFIRRR
jgi:hypothetical protein